MSKTTGLGYSVFDASAALALVHAGYDPNDLLDVTTLSDPPRSRFLLARPLKHCSYCQNDNLPASERCKTCGAPA